MRVRSLGWAGIEVEVDGVRAIVDAITGYGERMTAFVGPPRTELLAPHAPAELALVTHLHADHTDPAAIAAGLAGSAEGLLLRPHPDNGDTKETAGTSAAEAGLIAHAVPTRFVEPWETVTRGPFTATAVPAVDGFGDPQVSWVIEASGFRIFHGGDTVFHGHWWRIASRHGPFDAAFLPVNGAVCNFPHRQPASPQPADLAPAQAAAAAYVLGVHLAVPIHYDAIHAEGTYEQVNDPAGSFVAEAHRLGVRTHVLSPGETLDLTAPLPS